MTDKNTVEVSVLFPREMLETLKRIAIERHESVSDVLKRAVSNEAFFHEVRQNNEKVLIEKNGKFSEVIFK